MPRDLQQSDRNEMVIQDAISACEIILYYRQPTTAERIAFQKAAWVRQGKKMVNRSPEARAEFAAIVLTGIRDGDFSCGTDESGKPILISSNTGSPDYREDWKDLVIATAGDLLMLLGMQVFEGSLNMLIQTATTGVQNDDDDDQADNKEPAAGEGDILPLAKSSNG